MNQKKSNKKLIMFGYFYIYKFRIFNNGKITNL